MVKEKIWNGDIRINLLQLFLSIIFQPVKKKIPKIIWRPAFESNSNFGLAKGLWPMGGQLQKQDPPFPLMPKCRGYILR
jgi:hypothetical protein